MEILQHGDPSDSPSGASEGKPVFIGSDKLTIEQVIELARLQEEAPTSADPNDEPLCISITCGPAFSITEEIEEVVPIGLDDDGKPKIIGDELVITEE